MPPKKVKQLKNTDTYTHTVIKEGQYRNSKTTKQRVFNVKRSNNKAMTLDDVNHFYSKLKEANKNNIKSVQIVASTGYSKYWTLINSNTFEDYDENNFYNYFENKVKDTSKFDKFDSLTFNITYNASK